MMICRWLGVVGAGWLVGGACLDAAPVVNAEVVPGGVRIWIDGALFTQYVGQGEQRPYLSPLTGPSGANVARPVPADSQPDDHPHHRGMWFAHGSVNGVDFWTDGKDKGVQQHLDVRDIVMSPGQVSFRAYTRWLSPGGKKMLRDERRIRVTAGDEGLRTIDFTIQLVADQGRVVLGDTKEGSFAVRLCAPLSAEGEGDLLNSAGEKKGKVWGKRANWVSCFGPGPDGAAVTLTLFDHPQNLRHPTWWHARTYGLTAANPFGIHDFEKSDDEGQGEFVLESGETLTLVYRVRIEAGTADAGRLDREFQSFSTLRP